MSGINFEFEFLYFYVNLWALAGGSRSKTERYGEISKLMRVFSDKYGKYQINMVYGLELSI